MANNRVYVQLLGEFQLRVGKRVVFNAAKLKNNKPLQLMVLLLCQENHSITVERLIDSRLTDQATETPKSVYKNLAYRLRKLLKDKELCDEEVCRNTVSYENSMYTLHFSCGSDVDDMKNALRHAEKAQNEEECARFCIQALQLYQGDFLGGLLSEFWASEQLTQNKKIYFDTLEMLGDCFEKCPSIGDEVAAQFARAYAMYPYEETVYMRYLYTLYKRKRYNDAMQVYQNTCEALYNELGLAPPQSLVDFVETLFSGWGDAAAEVHDVFPVLEEEYDDGAYECALHEFSHIYQVMVRSMERTRRTVYLMLCTLREHDGEMPKASKRLKELTTALREVVRATLRREDVFARYSAAQYVFLLTDLSDEHCDVIAQRVRSRFYKIRNMGNLRLEFQHISAQEMARHIENQRAGILPSQP